MDFSTYVEMGYLSTLANEWPWNSSSVKELGDKEIYSQIITPTETSDEWEVPIQPCMPGMAYVGIRVSVLGKNENYSMYPRFVLGKSHFPLLGHPWDIQHCKNGQWAHLSYPMVPRLLKQPDKGSPTLLVAHNTPCFGKVELLAQKFDDLLEDDSNISYAYYDPLLDEVSMIHTPDDFFDAELMKKNAAPSWPLRVKILSPVRTLLYSRNIPTNNRTYQIGIAVKDPWNSVRLQDYEVELDD